MNLLPETATKTFNLLSIGQRGVGKTVFIAGSYAELHSDNQTDRHQQLWFDCQNAQVQENIESVINYITETSQYPPPTMKITDFDFSLKRHTASGEQTLCHFHWWDIPGESCNVDNPEFKMMVATSHGCCVFIDAYALIHRQGYLQVLKNTIIQVAAIANLAYINNLKYAFALILTKCDLLEFELSRHQLQEDLQPLTARLNAAKANYQTFYSFIPILHTGGVSTLKVKGAAAPLLWLVWELSKPHNNLSNHPLKLIRPLLPSRFQPRQDLTVQGMQSLFKPANKAPKSKKTVGSYLISTTRKNFRLLVVMLGLVGAIAALSSDYKWFFQLEATKLDSLSDPTPLLQRGQFDQAVPLMEKLVQQEPKRLDLRLQLAKLYQFTGQVSKAETAYDQVLAQQNNNLKALLGKAVLRSAQGDNKTAAALLAQAEQAAPTDLKAQVHAVAQKTLQAPKKHD